MRRFAAYIRVSTVRQGERGVSLHEQRAIIEAYARRENIEIAKWYEERETAAQTGRTLFKAMLRDLGQGVLQGLILHKIDRGARNLRDWASLSELADSGIDVRIAGDTLDLGSRGGRLSADIQAVVAADYIRNLREEVKKGQRGRLKQGLYPWGAPLGYLNTGQGQVKTIDPLRGPLVRRAFEAYATGNYSLRTLRIALASWGLVTSTGKPLTINALNALLRRPFYYGLIEVKGESFAGVHEPLISKQLFDDVAAVLDGRTARRSYESRPYVLRRLIQCRRCHRHLYAETQKGHVYYRCHSEGCQGTSLRETKVLRRILDGLARFPVTDAVVSRLEEMVEAKRTSMLEGAGSNAASTTLQLANLNERLERLTDAYLDRAIERETFDARKTALEQERLRLQQCQANPTTVEAAFSENAKRCLELLKTLRTLDELAPGNGMREVVKATVSNCSVEQKYVDITWDSSVSMLFAEEPVLECAHDRDSYRTLPGRQSCTSHHCSRVCDIGGDSDRIELLVEQLASRAIADARKLQDQNKLS